jgi:hypothetical protein
MGAHDARKEQQALLERLLEAGIALTYRTPITVTTGRFVRVTWPRTSTAGALFVEGEFGTLTEYRRLLRDQEFSCVLLDGALLQLSWDFRDNSLAKYRLCYYPCPVVLDASELALGEVSIEELLDTTLLEAIDGIDGGPIRSAPHLKNAQALLRAASPLRFDFDKLSAGPGHSASHLTVVQESCRVPVRAPLCLGQFVQLVFQHFYPALWDAHAFLRTWQRTDGDRTIADDELLALHVNWQPPL